MQQWFVVGSESVRTSRGANAASIQQQPSCQLHWVINSMRPSTVVLGGRSAWKGMSLNSTLACLYRLYFSGPFFVAFPNLREALINNTPIQTKNRSSTILPNYVGCVFAADYSHVELLTTACRIRFLVHNGKDYLPVVVTKDMVGHKLGEFSRKRGLHIGE